MGDGGRAGLLLGKSAPNDERPVARVELQDGSRSPPQPAGCVTRSRSLSKIARSAGPSEVSPSDPQRTAEGIVSYKPFGHLEEPVIATASVAQREAIHHL